MLDEDYGDITDPTEGRDIKVVCNKPPGRMWAMTEVRPRGKDSMLSSDKAQATGWIQGIPDIDDMFTCKTYEELEKIVNDWLNGDETDADDVGTSRGGDTSTTASSTTSDATAGGNDTSTNYKSLDDAFADLETM